MYFRIGLVVRVGIRVGFEIVGMRMDDDPAITCLVLMHEDCAADHDQTKQYRLEQRKSRTYIVILFHRFNLC